MRIGVITGSGSYAIPGAPGAETHAIETRFGTAAYAEAQLGGVDVVHLTRHGAGHKRLSNHVDHRSNLAALKALEVDAVLAVTVCGALEETIELGSLVVFDDLHFPANRLPDGRACTLYDEPGDPLRGHWVFDRPFHPSLRAALAGAARDTGHPVRDGGTYGHVDGPRFNTRSEIAQLAACGVTAVSQTAGPETVLAGEAELPYALLGYVTDHANGVGDGAPVAELLRLLEASRGTFSEVLAAALVRLADRLPLEPNGTVLRFE